MPDCQFCDYKPGDSGKMITGGDSVCQSCGYTYSVAGLMIYKQLATSKGGAITHRFLVLDSICCPQCGQDVHVFDVPCGGRYILELDFVKEKTYA